MSAPEQCDAIWEFLGILAPCHEAAVGYYRRGCIHEHMRDGWLCQDHLDNPHGCCRACAELPDGQAHDCPISLLLLEAVTP